jgi:hypothetical protein
VNVQVLADPNGAADLGLTRAARRPPRHGRRQRHGLIDALQAARVKVIADDGYRGAGIRGSPAPPPRRPRDPRAPPALTQPEGGQLRSRPSTRTGRAGRRPAQELEDPPQDPLLPPTSHRPGQGRARPHPRGRRQVERAQMPPIAGRGSA